MSRGVLGVHARDELALRRPGGRGQCKPLSALPFAVGAIVPIATVLLLPGCEPNVAMGNRANNPRAHSAPYIRLLTIGSGSPVRCSSRMAGRPCWTATIRLRCSPRYRLLYGRRITRRQETFPVPRGAVCITN